MGSDRVEQAPPLVGRDAELDLLGSIVGRGRTTGEGLVLLADAGFGKSRLLDRAGEMAALAGSRVVRCRGGRSETELAFAGLHQLVHGVIDRSAQLPESQRSALKTALGLSSADDEPTPLRVGVALLSLLSAVATEAPLVLIVDDAQWVDSASLDALAFVLRRAAEEPIILLAGARGTTPPRSLSLLPRLTVEPLDQESSSRLLDTLPNRLRGSDRRAVLSQAAGNPLAIIELARAVSTVPSAAFRWAAAPLPLTDRLYEIYSANLAVLPAATRRALLLAAVADAGDDAVLRAATTSVSAEDWRPAEEAGLVTAEDGEAAVRFRHPVVRAAVYRSASTAERRSAHQTVADLLEHYPDRRAWHLAAIAGWPDEEVAAQLEASARESGRRGAYVEAARALERAAELSAGPEGRVRRLARATDAAMEAGDVAWVRELASRVRDSTQDAAVLRMNAHIEATAVATTLDHVAAWKALRESIRMALPEDPLLALSSLTSGALVAQFTGDESSRREVLALAEELDRALDGHPAAGLGVVAAARMWIDAAVAPIGSREARVAALNDLVREEIADPEIAMMLGAAAMVLDETDTAVRLLGYAADRGRMHPIGYVSAAALTGLAWACVERGRWDDALASSSEGYQIALAGRQEMHLLNAVASEGTVAALRGDLPRARARISAVLASLDPGETAGLAARARQAAAYTAMAEDDHALAFHELSLLFHADGTPTHYQRSWYVLADLASCGIRSGAASQARTIVDSALAQLSGPLRPRVQLQVDRVRALLTDTDDAEQFYEAAVARSDARVPFELAQARLEYGEWLRRRRRVVEARTMLELAREDFERLGAGPMLDRTMSELRATGARHVERPRDLFGQLTPQQQRIARLAASGLTNREIGELLFLSPRTISTHLYALFPVLQITARAQLHELVPVEDPPFRPGSAGSAEASPTVAS